MKNEKTHQWAEALRTTDIPQSVEGLRNNNGACCMGILCEVVGIKAERKQPVILADGGTRFGYNYEGQGLYPPARVHDWLGLPTPFGRGNLRLDADGYPDMRSPKSADPNRNQMSKPLDYFNDSLRLTFAEIADLIDYFGVERA